MTSMTPRGIDREALFQCLRSYQELAGKGQVDDAREVTAKRGLSARIQIADQTFSLPLEDIKGIVRHPRIVAVAGAPGWMPGALRQGHQMLSVICGEWASGGQTSATPAERAVAVVIEHCGRRIALLVDAVCGLQQETATDSASACPSLDLDALQRRIDEQRAGGRASGNGATRPSDLGCECAEKETT